MIKKVYLIVFCISIVFIIYLVSVNSGRDHSKVSNINIEIVDSLENRFVNSDFVITKIRKYFKNQEILNINQINRQGLENFVNNNSYILKSEVYLLTNNEIKVKVWQRTPLFRVFSKNGYYVDMKGEVFPLSKAYTKRVLIVTGKFSINFALSKLYELCKFINNDDFFKNYISQLYIKDKNNVIIIPTVGDYSIEMGNTDEFKVKLEKLRLFLKSSDKNAVWGKYKSLNLKYKKQIVCVKR